MNHGFRLVRTETLSDYNGKAFIYEHELHHSKLIHVETPNLNNHFSISFKTTCNDDSGVNHVLEHVVLNGSRKYPIYDLFHELSKRTLASELNASTALDHTSYYFSTQNEKDFHNILDVFLDSVFHPNFVEDGFLMECHHLEFSDGNDPSSPLKHSGVVYSEMCGELSQSLQYFSEKLRMAMLPETPYKYVFGGDPDCIANLTLNDLIAYHKKYYSPSNSYIFHFGCFPIDPILERINSFLSTIEPVSDNCSGYNLIQSPFSEPKFITIEGPLDPMAEQSKACLSWHICNIKDIDLIQDFQFLALLLAGSASTPLYQKLIKTQIGSDFTQSGVDDETPNITFSIGLDHIKDENIEQFKTIVFDTFKEIIENGFTEEELQSTFHQHELFIKTLTSDPGSRMSERITGFWVNGIDPISIINQSERIEQLEKRIRSKPKYLESLIETYLLNNKSYVFLVMKPTAGFVESLNESRNNSINKDVTPEQRKLIEEKTKQFHNLATMKKPVELLPQIHIKDINPISSKIDVRYEDSFELFPMFTNGIVYINIKVDLPLNNKELLPNATMLSNVLGVIGCGDLDDKDFSIQESLYTNGITVEASTYHDKLDPNEMTGSFIIKTYFLKKNIKKAIELVETLLLDPYLDNEEEIYATLNSIDADFSSDLQENSYELACCKGAGRFSRTYALSDMWVGLAFKKRLEELKDSDEVIQIISSVYNELFRKGKFTCSIVSDEQGINETLVLLKPLLAELNKTTDHNGIKDYSFLDSVCASYGNDKVFYEFETMTNTTVSICKTVPFMSDLSVPLFILSKLLETEFLYPEIREKLGAYGVSCVQNSYSGNMYISTYRDTNCSSCLKVFPDTIQKATNGEFDDDSVERAIIQYFSYIDLPRSPNSKAKERAFSNVTDDEIQLRRTQALSTNKEGLVNAAKFIQKQTWYSYVFGSRSVSDIPEGFTVENIQ